MSTPTKILPFKRPGHPAALRLVQADDIAFPRFHREWNRPGPPPAPHPHGSTGAPPAGK